jgi:ubiquinone biosynthesis protein
VKIRVALRIMEIQRVLVRHGLDEFVRETHLWRPLRFIFLLSPWTWFERSKQAPRSVRLRLALEELGPIFVKFGQAVSTRRDLLPLDIADELAKLQDAVPPFPGAQARALIEAALGESVTKLFRAFDETPLAAASIAQVHAATMLDGTDVVVKVLRPGMHEVITRDLEVLHELARIAYRNSATARRLRVTEIVQDYEKTILDELDLMREAANASQLRRNFAGDDSLYVPDVFWDLCRVNVMVMERIRGVPISDMARLRELGTNIPLLAENGVKIFFTQVFRHNFFHADMHPGNIFVLVDDPARPRYAAVDFGIVGTLDARDQKYLAENFLAVFDRDYRRVATLHLESGWVPANTRIDEMESAIRTVCEPIFNKPLKEISFGQILLRLFAISRRFNMEIQPQLVLLQKTLLNVEGLGRQLYDELDIWKTATPILRDWMSERVSGATVIESLRTQLPEVLDAVRALPPLLKGAVQQAQDGTLRLRVEAANIDSLKQTIRDSNRRRDGITISAALLLGAIIWQAVAAQPAWAGWVLGFLGVLQLIRTWWRN